MDGAVLRTAAGGVARDVARDRLRDLPDGRRLRDRQPADQRHRRRQLDDRAADPGRALRGRAWPVGGDPRPDSARRRHPRRDHPHRRRVPDLDPGGDHRARVHDRLPADREPPPPAARLQPDGAALAARDPRLRADRREDRGHPRRPRGHSGRRDDPGLAPGLAAQPPRTRFARNLPPFRSRKGSLAGGKTDGGPRPMSRACGGVRHWWPPWLRSHPPSRSDKARQPSRKESALSSTPS